jgi:P27 family predicted phage terminase small subunit
MLLRAGVIAEGDYELLVMLAREWGRLQQAEDALARDGMIVMTKNGFPVPSPYLGIVRGSVKAIQTMLTELGLTPSSRTRISATGPSTEKDDLLDG